jgi:hypothetical protein
MPQGTQKPGNAPVVSPSIQTIQTLLRYTLQFSCSGRRRGFLNHAVFPILVGEQRKANRSIVVAKHQAARFDLSHIPPFDLLAEARANNLFRAAGADHGPSTTFVGHNAEQNDPRRGNGRWRRRDLLDDRRRWRRRPPAWREQRSIARDRPIIKGLGGERIFGDGGSSGVVPAGRTDHGRRRQSEEQRNRPMATTLHHPPHSRHRRRKFGEVRGLRSPVTGNPLCDQVTPSIVLVFVVFVVVEMRRYPSAWRE